MADTITIKNERDMVEFAKKCAGNAYPNDIFTLQGEMGAGKSFFARHFIRHLCGADIDVPSPTFTLVQEYQAPQTSLWHFDLYRLENAEEIYEIGWEEALSAGICLIEWPERLGLLLPAVRKEIIFEITGDESRTLTFTSFEN